MPIEIRTGDLFRSGAHTLVNAVNCHGVMGAGLALQFKQRYPGMYARYRISCRNGAIKPGSVMFDDSDGQHVANVATKDHWRDESTLEWVDCGLKTLAGHVEKKGVPSMAVPALGCGLGGLEFRDVFPLMLNHLKWTHCRVTLYVPIGCKAWAESTLASATP